MPLPSGNEGGCPTMGNNYKTNGMKKLNHGCRKFYPYKNLHLI